MLRHTIHEFEGGRVEWFFQVPDMELMTIQQVQRFFQVSRPTVYRWLKTDATFPRPVVKGRWLRHEVESWVLRHRG